MSRHLMRKFDIQGLPRTAFRLATLNGVTAHTVPVICLHFDAIDQMEWKPMDALVSLESPVCAHSRPFPIISALQLLPSVFSCSSVHPAISSVWNLPLSLSQTTQNGNG
jgi:hypothetical protein